MNSLQLWLALLGACVLAILLFQALWLSRRVRKHQRTEPVMGQGGDPVGLIPPGARVHEPLMGVTVPVSEGPLGGGAPSAAAPSAADRLDRLDRVTVVTGDSTVSAVSAVSAVAAADTVPAPPPRRPALGARLDPLIDAIALLRIDAPMLGQGVIAHMPVSRRAGSKPFLIEGCQSQTRQWGGVAADVEYREFRVGVQMANRHGPLNEIEYSEFVQKIQAFADAISASPDFPDMLNVVARGRELDAFAAHLDAQLIMRLRTQPQRAPWPVSAVQWHASRHGFVAGTTPGRLVLPGREEGSPPILSLEFDAQAALADNPHDAQVSELVLAFDVPQTSVVDQPFNAWCAAGQALALGLEAEVTDDQGRELSPSVWPTIEQDLKGLYRQMREHGLSAGARSTRRMFS
ncbi:MAG: cell division protein FtsZ [Leptothrix ochracea]|uniref:cell division protein FtsZ n=1 Tax=Leptothrix ochracea TaxID=735331 RepID=UPI0034E23C4E